MRLAELQEQIGRGEYRVDAQAVADAIVRRLIQDVKVTCAAHERSQEECS